MEVVNQFLGYWNLFGHHSLIDFYFYQPFFLRPSHIQLSMWYNQIDTNGNKTLFQDSFMIMEKSIPEFDCTNNHQLDVQCLIQIELC
jgi:hypothetical protein